MSGLDCTDKTSTSKDNSVTSKDNGITSKDKKRLIFVFRSHILCRMKDKFSTKNVQRKTESPKPHFLARSEPAS
ncbi:hypothetical protein DP44_5690 [Burkholderia pseudomallei]|nr:hypothetical protein DP44_5690 [Burkholderia pseudomallei]